MENSRQAKLARSTLLQSEDSEAPELKNKPFWIWNPEDHETAYDDSDKKCCFWHIIGLPIKEHLVGRTAQGKEIILRKTHNLKRYQKEWLDALELNRYLWIKKAAGMAATTFFLGHMAHLALKNDKWKDASMGIVTGPRINLAVDEIKRIPTLFRRISYQPKPVGPTITLNGCKIEAFPSHTFDTARGIEKIRYWFVDEGDFFPKNQAEKARQIVERYEAKTHPFVIFNSTANLPGGLFDRMEKEEDSIYTKIFSLYEKGLAEKDPIYTPFEIEEAKKSRTFDAEYNGMYGIGRGNIFNHILLDEITEQYELSPQGGIRILAVDPAFGGSETSSKFGIVGLERREGIIYVVEAQQHSRSSTEAMTERVAQIYVQGKYTVLQVDSAHPGLIRDWNSGSVKVNRQRLNAHGVIFKDVLTEMTVGAETKIKEKVIRIHPSFSELISQLKSIEFNEKGHPDKKKLTFDLGDAFLMGLNYWRTEITARKLKGKF